MGTKTHAHQQDAKRALLLALTLVTAIVFLRPVPTEKIQLIRFHSGLTIKVSKRSPPLAILQDEKIVPLIIEPSDPLMAKTGQIVLSAQRGILRPDIFKQEDKKSRIFSEPPKIYFAKVMHIEREEEIVSFQVPNGFQAKQFRGLRLKHFQDGSTQASDLKSAAESSQSRPSFGQDTFPSRGVSSSVAESKRNHFENQGEAQAREETGYMADRKESSKIAFLDSLPENLRRRAERAENLNQILNTDWSQPRIEDHINKVLAQPAPPQQPVPPSQPAPLPKPKTEENTAQRFQSIEETNGFGGSDFSAANKSDSHLAEAHHQTPYAGHIEMADGLAYMGGGQQLMVTHRVDGEIRSHGDVSIHNGTFNIEINNAEEGVLVAELRTPEGALVGRGHLDLVPASNLKLENKVIFVRPVKRSARGVVLSAYSTGPNNKGISDAEVSFRSLAIKAKTVLRGLFVRDGLVPNSTFIVEVGKKEFWKAISLGSNDEDMAVTLFPEKMISGLADFLGESKEFEKGGVIWGQVKVNGKPVEGAHISIDGQDNAKGPIYFNSLLLPDTHRSTTGKNGAFAFINAKPGVQLVRAYYAGAELPTKVVPTEERAVTKVEFSSTKKKIIETSVFDAFTNAPLASSTKFTGSLKMSWTDTGLLKLKISQGTEPIFLETDGGPGYMQSRVASPRTASKVGIPLVPFDWLRNIARDFEIKMSGKLSTTIGFIKGDSFSVVIDSKDANKYTRLLYFNAKGEAMGSAKAGVAGGGFILFNMPPGFRTIMVQPQSKKETLSKLVLNDPDAASIINHQF